MIRPSAASAALSALLLASAAYAQTVGPAPVPGQGPTTAGKDAIDQRVDQLLGGSQDAMVAVDAGDDALLYGSYRHPDTGKYSLVLILPAAGVDRNGNEAGKDAKPDTYKQLAQALMLKGIASVRIDKRGIGGSAKAIDKEDDLRFETYVDDAVTWIKFVQALPHVGCVAVLGHSESALVAALAAKKVKVCAIIEMSGSSRPAAALLADQLKTASDAGRLDKDTYGQATKILNELAAGKTVPDPPSKLSAMFRSSVQPYLISWLALNPVDALNTSTPVLILQGSGDRSLAPDEARKLAAGAKAERVVMIVGADHDLKLAAAPTGKSGFVAEPQVSPQVATAIADFLDRVK